MCYQDICAFIRSIVNLNVRMCHLLIFFIRGMLFERSFVGQLMKQFKIYKEKYVLTWKPKQ